MGWAISGPWRWYRQSHSQRADAAMKAEKTGDPEELAGEEPFDADVRKSLDAALASPWRNEAMRAGAERELLRDQLPGISTVGFSGRGARERHRWLVLRRRCPFSGRAECCGTSWSCAMYHCACRYLLSACAAPVARAQAPSPPKQPRFSPTRQLGSRVAKPPFCHSAISPSYPLDPGPYLFFSLAICASLCIFGIKTKQKAHLTFPHHSHLL